MKIISFEMFICKAAPMKENEDMLQELVTQWKKTPISKQIPPHRKETETLTWKLVPGFFFNLQQTYIDRF